MGNKKNARRRGAKKTQKVKTPQSNAPPSNAPPRQLTPDQVAALKELGLADAYTVKPETKNALYLRRA